MCLGLLERYLAQNILYWRPLTKKGSHRTLLIRTTLIESLLFLCFIQFTVQIWFRLNITKTILYVRIRMAISPNECVCKRRCKQYLILQQAKKKQFDGDKRSFDHCECVYKRECAPVPTCICISEYILNIYLSAMVIILALVCHSPPVILFKIFISSLRQCISAVMNAIVWMWAQAMGNCNTKAINNVWWVITTTFRCLCLALVEIDREVAIACILWIQCEQRMAIFDVKQCNKQ